MTFEDKLKNIFPIHDNSVLLAFLTILGYSCAYVFELGYLSYFEIPSTFIQIDIITTIRATAIVIFTIYLLLSIAGLASDLLNKSHPLWQVVGEALAVVLILTPFIYINTWTSIIHVYFLFGTFVFFLLLALLPPLFHKDIKSYWSRVSRVYPTTLNQTQSKPKIETIFGSFIFNGIIFFLLITLVYGLGGRHAKNQSEFLSLKYQPNMIIVRIYADTIIAKEVNLDTHLVNNNIQIFKADSNPLEITTSNLKYVISKTDKEYLDSLDKDKIIKN